MTEWKQVRDSTGNAAMLTDSEDGWTEALASPKSEIRSPFSEAASDSFVDVGVTGHSSPERSVSPFSLVSTEPERFVPENHQDLAHEEGSQDESAHNDNPFDDDTSPEDEDDESDDDDAGEMPEDFDTGNTGDWDTRSVRTITARKKEAEETIAADELLAIQMAEQIRREIMDAEVARWIEQAPFPDDFDITFENLLAHGLISPEVLETLEQVDPSGLNPKYRYVEKEPEVKEEPLGIDLGQDTDLEGLNTGTLPLNIKPKASIPPYKLVTYSEETNPPKKEEEAPKYPPQAIEPDTPLVLNVCGICKGYYRPAENPLVSTLASPSSFKSPYFDPNQASPFPFGLDLNCPAMHGSCIDCMEKHIISQLKIGDRMAFPIRCPACVKEEDDQDIDRDDHPTKGFVWEVHDALAEKILGHKSMDLWRERKEQERQLYLSLNQPQIIQNFDENHALIESIIVLKVVEPELVPPKITPASLQSGAIWMTGRELEADREPNLAQCKICMEYTFLVTYPSIASQIAPRRVGLPAYGLELECPNSHAFCAPCLTKYVTDCMGNVQRGSKVMCPACAGDMAAAVSGASDDWEEGKEITNEVVGKFLNEHGLAKWGVWKARLAARTSHTFVCPNAECAKDLEIQEPKPEYDRGQCAECETKVCLECRAMFHDGLSCAENKALLAPEDKLFYSFAKKRLMRRCPQCQMVVAKDPGGCNRVTCVCGYQFCWRCGGLYRSVKTDFQGCNGLCPEWVEDKTLLPVESEARASSSSSMEE